MLTKVRSWKLEVGSKKWKSKSLFSIFFFLFSLSSYAQCAMCRATLTGEENKTQAEAVNNGIVYLMIIPYLLVGAIGYYIYRMRKKKE